MQDFMSEEQNRAERHNATRINPLSLPGNFLHQSKCPGKHHSQHGKKKKGTSSRHRLYRDRLMLGGRFTRPVGELWSMVILGRDPTMKASACRIFVWLPSIIYHHMGDRLKGGRNAVCTELATVSSIIHVYMDIKYDPIRKFTEL